MATVALTDAEKITLRSDTVLANTYREKIVIKAANYTGLTTGDVAWAKGRIWAASIENNSAILFGDPDIINVLMYNMAERSFLNKDDTASGLTNQVIAYLNASSRFDFLVDDYFTLKTRSIIF
jgi:hypothetical protein